MNERVSGSSGYLEGSYSGNLEFADYPRVGTFRARTDEDADAPSSRFLRVKRNGDTYSAKVTAAELRQTAARERLQRYLRG